MLLAVVLCLIPGLIHQSLQANFSAKCCPEDFVVQEINNSSLGCSLNVKSRFQFWSNFSNFLQTGDNGKCIDSDGDKFFIYNVTNSTLTSKIAISEDVFPKCCPLKHLYNKTTHSCTQNGNISEDFLQSQMVKVGLPHCRIVTDKTFSSLKEANSWVKQLKPGNYCVDQNVDGKFITRECEVGMDVCEKKRCFKKCCPDGQSFVGGGFCKDTYVNGLKLDSQWFSKDIEDIEDDYEIIYGVGCRRVNIYRNNTINFTFRKNGAFRYYDTRSSQFLESNHSDFKTYCLEHSTKNDQSGYFLFWCMASGGKLDGKFAYTLWAKSVSCVCLLITILIYFYVGEVKSSFGKILMNYCAVMIILMVTLLVTHLTSTSSRLVCKIRAYLIFLFSMAAFTWVNVMSLDIWWTFGTPRRTIGHEQKIKDLKKFLLYLVYGWGLPLCLTLLVLIFDSTDKLPKAFQPHMGIFQCVLETRVKNYGRVVFLLIPQLILQIINTILFVKTITYCIKVKNEMSRMNDSSRIGKVSADKEKLGLIVKLAVIMGVIWIFEAVTAFFPNMKSEPFTMVLEIIFDNITCLQGLFIFLIFICKKKTLKNLKIKLGMGKRKISSSTSVTQSSHLNGHYPMNKEHSTLSINDSKM